MHFELTSDRDVTVDGIGLLKAGETKIVTDEERRLFQALHGKTVARANFPDFVSVVYNTESGKEV